MASWVKREEKGEEDREFSHWKVSSLATEKRDFLKAPLPLAPEFLRNLRLLGRRPTLQQINENLIKKYGTHFLISATLGGEESLTIFLDKQKLNKKSESNSNSSVVSLELLHQLAASYFTDRESTLRRLHHLQIATSAIKVTETRTGPLGCSNYDSLDSVSSVLVHSPENKIHLKGEVAITHTKTQPRTGATSINTHLGPPSSSV
ncbi:BMP/retinoic acid-inducible neural-specific protein 3 [Takifugu flavidus]|uniref:BMP/retinoic acid-inducible neural-specific protein 3 n=1 Tax=Takifugu flavidus TaxID=433684 RepID=A0A5C6P3L0_9TELE|nr:BMP/retinoic acid-inducible neural-specific protein 3 [Takifugu flavidus]